MQSHRRAWVSLHHRAEAAGDLVVTEPAPAGSSPLLEQLMFALEALVPMGIPESHNLSDHRKQITDLPAMKKLRGEEEKVLLFLLPSSPKPARALSGSGMIRNHVSPQVHMCCQQAGRQQTRRVCGIWGQTGV